MRVFVFRIGGADVDCDFPARFAAQEAMRRPDFVIVLFALSHESGAHLAAASERFAALGRFTFRMLAAAREKVFHT